MLQISPYELSGLLAHQPDAVIIDVRFLHEREEIGYVNGSHHIPMYNADWDPNPEFAAEIARIASADTPLIFVCRTGNRSCEACEMARANGYQQVYNLREGYVGLVNLMSKTDSANVCHLLKLPECAQSMWA